MQQIMPGAAHWTKRGQNKILTSPSLIAACPSCPEWSSSLVEEKVGCDEVIKDCIRRHIRQEVELKLRWQPLFWQFLLLLLDFAALMMMYEFTAAYPPGWRGPRGCPVILRGDGNHHLHHVGWRWGTSSRGQAQSDKEVLLLITQSFTFSAPSDTKEMFPGVVWSCRLRLMPSQGFAALWHMLHGGPSVPLGLWCSSQSPPCCLSEKK